MLTRIAITLCAFAAIAASVSPARAQDPVKVDSTHYKVLFENQKVRVLRIHYEPGEKSVMHEHPDSVAVYLHDQKTKFTTPDGKSQVTEGKAGDASWASAGKHLPEDVGDTPLDVVLVELKKDNAK